MPTWGPNAPGGGGGGGGGGKFRQSVFQALSADQTMNSGAYVPLGLAANITTSAGGKLAIDFSCSAASDAALGTPISFEVRLDGVRLGCCSGFFGVGARQSVAFVFETSALAPGAHTVDVLWRRGAGVGNCHVRPVTQGDWEQASLRVEEVEA